MPPSGYNDTQASAVCDFLRSCTVSLVQENRGVRDPNAAIQREIDSISRDLQHEKRGAFEHDLLGLTKAFYQALLKECPQDLDRLAESAEEVLTDFRSRILEITVSV